MKTFALILLFLLICAVVLLKIEASPRYYLTPDSQYYLQASTHLLSDLKYQIYFGGQIRFCAIWPIGYSGLISLCSWLSSLSPYWSSKVVNLLAVCGCFVWLRSELKGKFLLIALAFGSPSMLQLYANTWSETVFLFGLMSFVFTAAKPSASWWSVMSWGIFVFLIRYVGGFVVIELLVLIGYQKARHRPAEKERKALAGISLFMMAYLGYNYHQTGTFSGGHGYPPEEPFGRRVWVGLQGIAQEAFGWFRDWDIKDPALSFPVLAFIFFLSAAQGVVLFRLVHHVIRSLKPARFSPVCRQPAAYFLLTGTVYFISMVAVYLTDASIEDLRFRRLAPSSLLLTVGALTWLTDEANQPLFSRVKPLLIAFFLLAMVHAVPKMYLYRLFF